MDPLSYPGQSSQPSKRQGQQFFDALCHAANVERSVAKNPHGDEVLPAAAVDQELMDITARLDT